MQKYRAYIVGPDGHFKTSKIVTAEDDESAVALARQFADEYDVEVWCLDRKVAEIKRETTP
ncbi:MAG: hypothetical protein NT113_04740 [Hyphomicrobiales bacterium]|jgi:hypothetical protein|nr:hypothetical protein [Hyphomicrobiales bacterium]